jgi:hypothetical protein
VAGAAIVISRKGRDGRSRWGAIPSGSVAVQTVIYATPLLGEARRNPTHRRRVLTDQLRPLLSSQIDQFLQRDTPHDGNGLVVT